MLSEKLSGFFSQLSKEIKSQESITERFYWQSDQVHRKKRQKRDSVSQERAVGGVPVEKRERDTKSL